MIEYTYQEKIVARILISLNKALTRPEFDVNKGNLRTQVLVDTKEGMKLVTDEEITKFLGEHVK